MAKSAKKRTRIGAQPYPRIQDPDDPDYDCLDDSRLVQHTITIPTEQVKAFIRQAIEDANKKSSRAILNIAADATQEELDKVYKREGKKLLQYFKKYSPDPAATAQQVKGKPYTEVGRDLFKRRSLQKERMNSGWRYQYLTIYCARATERFKSVSDIGSQEADFNAQIGFLDYPNEHLNLFVSVKNRRNTVGGQDFPKVARALELEALNNMNRIGPYLCVFGIAMDRGTRQIRRDRQKRPHAANTEIWLSDYFWPFFTNYSYEDIMALVLEVLEQLHIDTGLTTDIYVPDEFLRN